MVTNVMDGIQYTECNLDSSRVMIRQKTAGRGGGEGFELSMLAAFSGCLSKIRNWTAMICTVLYIRTLRYRFRSTWSTNHSCGCKCLQWQERANVRFHRSAMSNFCAL
jgi:hypothetical protein